MNSGSDNDNLSSSSDESEDSDSLSNASDDELENLFAGFGVDLPDDIHWGNVRFQRLVLQYIYPILGEQWTFFCCFLTMN